MELKLDSSVQYVPRVGPRMATLLRKLGIETVYDLLTYVPFRYNDYSHITPIRQARPGEIVTIVGTLEYIRTFVTKTGKRLVMGSLRDSSGEIEVTWFNQQYLIKILSPGITLSASGKIDWFGNKIVLSSPEYEIIGEHIRLHTGRLVPVYPETQGLSSKWLRGRIAFLLDQCLSQVNDRIPENERKIEKLIEIKNAIRSIHFPESQDAAETARDRLAFDEVFTLMLRSYEQKRLWKTTLKSKPLPITKDQFLTFIKHLPFVLTTDQNSATEDLLHDLSQPIPMNRLLEGDVGSGKTVVAAAGIYAAYINHESSALLAPTQILAEQHYRTLNDLLNPHGITVTLMIGGKHKNKELRIKNQGKNCVYVGTHALLSSSLDLPHFGLIVIDEQQRFGVAQRAMLRKQSRGNVPHQLTMTATPIPRTIAQTVFGNLDLSILHSLPKGRLPVKTWLVPTAKHDASYQWIQKQLDETSSQAFFVCPLIEESETLKTVKAVTTEYTNMKRIFAPRRVGLLHGRLKNAEKSTVLEEFRNHALDILVATPVVEVGIDIPNATIIVIEAAERFGLSQLHQLRGRVGRRGKSSYCLLFTEVLNETVLTRLKSLETVHNGPELAELDLKLRGPGELFGTRQHGVPGFTLAKLTDSILITRVKRTVLRLTALDPTLERFPYLRELLRESKIDPETSSG